MERRIAAEYTFLKNPDQQYPYVCGQFRKFKSFKVSINRNPVSVLAIFFNFDLIVWYYHKRSSRTIP